ncbi:MAG TPA: hypothetical protein VLB09_08630 [Nitrospiria bacterium]|nr:hypothetical protein [Nitrospiria bacterium]
MIKKSGLFLGFALVVLSLTFAGCTEKKAGKEMAPEAAEEAPAAEMAEDMEEAPMAPAEGEEGE